MSLSYFVFAIITWLLLAALRSLQLKPSSMSQFELERRIALRDPEAAHTLERDQRLPDIYALRYLAETVLLIVFIALVVIGYSFINGIAITIAALLLLPLLSRATIISSLAQKVYLNHEKAIIHLVITYQPLLSWLADHSEVRRESAQLYSKDELLYLVKNSKGVLSTDEKLLIEQSLAFSHKIVQAIMTPSAAIDYAEENETVGPVVLDRLHKTGHSRFPVIKGDINHIVGMLYMHDLVPLDKTLKTVKKAMHPEVYYIRQDKTLEHALHAFLRTRASLLIVVNEHRETVGLLSLEDTIEALLGRKIVDDFDAFHDLRSVAGSNPGRR